MNRHAATPKRRDRSLYPRRLRSQLALALTMLGLLVTTSNLIAIVALHDSAATIHRLADERVARLDDAQEIVAGALEVERDARTIATASSVEEVRAADRRIAARVQRLDALVERLGASTGDISVLTLYQSDQLFRNAAHVLAGLRESVLSGDAALSRSIAAHAAATGASPGEILLLRRLRNVSDPGEIGALHLEFVRASGNASLGPDDPFALRLSVAERADMLHRFQAEIEVEGLAMVFAAEALTERLTTEHRDDVARVAAASAATERWVLTLLAGTLALAGLGSRLLIERRVLARLQVVSDHLRCDPRAGPVPHIPVEGVDEIAEMARAVEQFMEDRRRLQTANRDLKAFSYSVAHDLRAPLRAINGFCELLLTGDTGERGDEARRLLSGIHRNARRMGALIDDILKLSRAGREEIRLERVDMGALARDAFEEARAADPERRVTFRLGELPEAFGDHTLLRQVWSNLIGNAVKFTAHQSEAVVAVAGAVEGHELVYLVRDNGIGFDMRQAERIFGVFERLHGPQDFEGTGIGLAIVKRIVERHGGRVWAEGTPGEGATFTFTLPRRPTGALDGAPAEA